MIIAAIIALYSVIKEQLAKEGNSTKYFTKSFLSTFAECYAKSKESGTAQYEEVFKTPFYQKNSATYCRFLELVNENGGKLNG